MGDSPDSSPFLEILQQFLELQWRCFKFMSNIIYHSMQNFNLFCCEIKFLIVRVNSHRTAASISIQRNDKNSKVSEYNGFDIKYLNIVVGFYFKRIEVIQFVCFVIPVFI